MIKFFRTIRKDLMENNRTGKYLKYAIGEIVLVVIGILIALQINNWNEKRKDRIKEKIILTQLKEDYNSNLIQLDQKIKMRSNLINSAMAVLKHIDTSNTLNEDVIIPELMNVIKDPTFDPIENNIIGSGDINLIQNDSLKRLLSRWTSDFIQVKQLELDWQKMRTDILIPFLIDVKIARNFHHQSWKGTDLPIELLDKNVSSKLYLGESSFKTELKDKDIKQRLEGIMATAISPNHVANLQSMALRSRILKILEILNNQLNKE